MRKVVIFAAGIHSGGGLTLLKNIIESWDDQGYSELFLDERSKLLLDVNQLDKFDSIFWIKHSFFGRINAYFRLSRTSTDSTTTLCLNNLPPIFKCEGYTVTFLQNIHIIQKLSSDDWDLFSRLKNLLEKTVFYIFSNNVNEYIVQTMSMKKRLKKLSKSCFSFKKSKITVMPFFKSLNINPSLKLDSKKQEIDFLYIADSQPHKNHKNLFKAWVYMSEKGLYPNLSLTIPISNKKINDEINDLISFGLNIRNYGLVEYANIGDLFEASRALIYPSLQESFGLPLVEASSMALPIIASDLDYVFDVCEPDYVFNPNCHKSIARAVMRFLNKGETIQKIIEPKEFVEYIHLTSIKNLNERR